MDEVRGREILPLVKERCESCRKDLAGKEIKIIRFEPSLTEEVKRLPQYEAARYSTESKVKTFEYFDCKVESLLLPDATLTKDFEGLISKYNDDQNIVGIIIQNPIPDDLKDSLELIDYKKDIDGMREDNPYFSSSATSETIFRLVESFAQKGDTVAVVGAGGFVGGGVVQLLKEAGFNTIELDLKDDNTQTRNANIVVSATGDPGSIDTQHIIPEHRLVVDAGFVPQEGEGKPQGDVSRSAYDIPQNLTPVPGGVGPFQMATLLERLVSQVSDIEIEPWVYPGPEVEMNKGIKLEPEQIEMFTDVAYYWMAEAEEQGVTKLTTGDYEIDISDGNIIVAATDGQRVVFTENDEGVQYDVTEEDIKQFEAIEKELFPEYFPGIEEDIEDNGWEMD